MTLLLTLAVRVRISWQITLLALALLPVFVLPAKWMGRRLARLQREAADHNAATSTQMTERFSAPGATSSGAGKSPRPGAAAAQEVALIGRSDRPLAVRHAQRLPRLRASQHPRHARRHRRLAWALMRPAGVKEWEWRANFFGRYDGGYEGEARAEFGEGEWRACFHHEPAADDGGDYAPDHAATDQVRFERRDGRRWREVPLAEVKPPPCSACHSRIAVCPTRRRPPRPEQGRRPRRPARLPSATASRPPT